MKENVVPEMWIDGSVDFISVSRWRPDVGDDTFECIQAVAHPDGDGSVLFMHEMVDVGRYFDEGVPCPVSGTETDELTHILAGWGYKNIEEFLVEEGTYEECWKGVRGAPGWQSLACLICGSKFKDGAKLSPEEASERSRRYTGIDYSVEDFTDLDDNGYNRVKALRSKSGMSQSQMADFFDIPVRTLQGWEAGKIRGPKHYVMSMMERLMAVRVRDEFLEEERHYE